MKPTIFVLAPELASQIAAGEVVERPASVVKELVENALDAGAGRVDVTIEGGGISLIEVADDGSGMHPEDLRFSVERHATSKLRQFSDLDEIRSYGFRGEALPSIASVARLTLRTRAASYDEATELYTEGLASPQVRPASGPVGTTVRVADLFYNVPARRKFLRSTGTEAGHVGDVLLDAALARPEVTFTLSRDGRRVRSWPRCPERRERTVQLMGEEELIECSGERGPLAVLALLSRPERARQGAAGLKVLVNGRPVRDRALAGTLAHAYGSVLEKGRYPRGVLYLDLPQRLVDVNVHPQKSEVRFADPRAVSDAVHSIVARELSHRLGQAPRSRPSVPPRAGGDREASPPFRGATGMSRPLPALVVRDMQHPEAAPSARVQESAMPQGAAHPGSLTSGNTASESEAAQGERTAAVSGSQVPFGKSPPGGAHEQPAWGRLRYLTQVRDTYLICEGSEGLYVLDQHAAAERVVFSRLLRQYRSRSVATQALLFPVTLEVTPQESDVLTGYADQVATMGLDVRIRTPEAVSIHAVPRLLQKVSPQRLLRDLITEVTRMGQRAFSDAVDKALATMACHAAVRAGDTLSPNEATALLAALDEADFAAYCPHGRPIVAFTSWEELERKVGRR